MGTGAVIANDETRVRASRGLWLVLVALALALTAAAVPLRYAMLREDAYGFGTAVPATGLSYPVFAAYFTTLEVGFVATFLLIATLVLWRRVANPMAWLFAGTLATFGFLLPLFDGLSAANSAWLTPLILLRLLISTGFFATLCLFPDGRFVPAWSRWYLVGWACFVLLMWPLVASTVAGTALIPQTRTLTDSLSLLATAAWTAAGLAFQAVRYRRYASPAQRQQTKWVLFGLLLLVAATVANALLLTLVPPLREDARSNFLFTMSMGSVLLLGGMGLALCVAVAVLRHQLWDIDILLNRTLVYGGLTALITIAYGLLVGMAGAMSRGRAGYLAGAAVATALVLAFWRPTADRWRTAVDRLVPPGGPPATPVQHPDRTVARDGLPLLALWWGVCLLTGALLLAGLFAMRRHGLGWLALPTDLAAGGPLLLQPVLRLDPRLLQGLLLGSAAQALIFLLVGIFLVVRRPGEPVVVLASLMLITVGVGFTAPVVLLPALDPAWHVPATVLQAVMFGSVVLFLYVFPNGRFTPAWTRYAAIAWAVYAAAWLLWPQLNPHRSTAVWPVLAWVGWVASGLVAQVQRYRGPATAEERQQAKWVIAGFVAANIGLLIIVVGEVGGATPGAPRSLARGQAALLGLSTLLIPLTVTISLLRYRLWDIDFYINRSLVYGGLTALVIGAYVLLVGGLSTLFQAQNSLLLSLLVTGLIAVLFQPLRAHLQGGVNRLMFGERDNPYGLLADLGRQIRDAGLPEESLEAVTGSLCAQLKLPYAAIELATANGRRRVASCGSAQAGESWPLLYQGEVVGWLIATPRAPEQRFGAKERQLLETIAAQAGAAAYALRLNTALQRSREQLVLAREEERRRLRRDLHDGLGPALASQTFTLEAALEALDADPDTARALLTGLKGRNRDVVADIRRLVYELRPPALDQLGLAAALAAAIEQIDGPGAPLFSLRVQPDPLPPLPAAVEVAAYFIAREAVTNVQRHAQARHGRVSFTAADGSLTVTVVDDGVGMAEQRPSGVGLASMRERAEELGGRWQIESRPEAGTVMTAVLPLPRQGSLEQV